ncbi:M61 family metallopeptidase [Mariniblastus fucicola]|uniref:M61 glycyl aminopeptidase n=1 Tax=Mariniblastus fucicola TaxID=980251 RepID=A0A5B9P658_9BACT|nr:M61 family metallopeptidase [Mariniblastus fucicola]QEG20665.1 M61 glycyl aminopeptidase [Mariniblastus fucicola]
MKRFLTFAIAIALFAFNSAYEHEAVAQLNYKVNLDETAHRYIHVTLEFEAEDDQTELMMAVWTPGSYLVREYARHIDSMTVTDQDDQPLPFRKTRKNRWMVETEGGGSVKVSYRLYCNEESVRTNFVNHDYAVLNGAPTFITLPDRLDQEHIVSLKLASDWKRSATSLTRGESPHVYVAENFDELVDSPIVAGNIQVYPFEVGGIQHQLVNIGEQGMWDGATAASDLTKVVEAHQKMWGTVPYDRYLFLNVLSGGGGGLEHNNSTLVISSRWSYRETSRYKSWLSLCSHEFFHTWNVRRLRPKPLMKYDYENEVYTDGLWIAEGITSYYQDLALVRAGIISKSKFMSGLSSEIESVQRTDGRKFQSLRDSSFDTWIKFYRPDENSRNTRISYYAKGAVVAFLLDMKIRSLTENKKSLDDVMRKMYRRYSKKGFTAKNFRSVASQVAGEKLDDWFANAIDSTNELEYDSSLTFMGIKIPESAIESDEKPQPNPSSGGTPTIGASFSGNQISRVDPDSQAWQLGLASGDEVLAINGFRLAGSFTERLRQYEIGDRIELLISRDERLFSETVTLERRVRKSWSIGWVSSPSDEQKQRIDSWLEIEPPESDKEKEAKSDEESVGQTSDDAAKKKKKRRRKKPNKS